MKYISNMKQGEKEIKSTKVPKSLFNKKKDKLNNIDAINNKDNVVLMPEFNGNGKDRELLMSIVFFKEIGKKDVIDVRNEIKKYGNYRTYINFYKSNIKYKNLIPNNIKI